MQKVVSSNGLSENLSACDRAVAVASHDNVQTVKRSGGFHAHRIDISHVDYLFDEGDVSDSCRQVEGALATRLRDAIQSIRPGCLYGREALSVTGRSKRELGNAPRRQQKGRFGIRQKRNLQYFCIRPLAK